jgi:hypothetical protein
VFRPIRALLFLTVLAVTSTLLHAQGAVFVDKPEYLTRRLVANHPEIPVQTSCAIAVIEANAPSYISAHDKDARLKRLDWLVTLEYLRLYKPETAFSNGWYEFVAATAPTLLEAEIDAVAQDWWSAMGSRAVKRDEHEVLHEASFEEVRAHFEALRTGNEMEAFAAIVWLIAAEPDKREKHPIRLPPQARDVSPLAHLLARDIAQELPLYTGPEAAKLRSAVKKLLTGRFQIAGDTGIAHVIDERDVDALLDTLSANPEKHARALPMLEDWLTRAIDADLQAMEDAASAYSRSH